MIVTTYTCDKCGHEQTETDQMWKIGVTLSYLGSPKSSYDHPKAEQLWCRNCVEELGFLERHPDEEPVTDPEPTFEEIVRKIIHEEIEAA